jgi:hypothetical protein
MNNREPVPLHCPRCGNIKNLIVYEETFDCPSCKLEFEIKDIELYDDDQILSIEEKKRLNKEFLE